jgi:hypothetical protein
MGYIPILKLFRNIGSIPGYLPRVIPLSNRGKTAKVPFRAYCLSILLAHTGTGFFIPAVRYSLWRRQGRSDGAPALSRVGLAPGVIPKKLLNPVSPEESWKGTCTQ